MSRMEIALGVARGLDYIHHRTGFDVVLTHNNINSTNIIINSTSQQTKPMICNFGLALANGKTAAAAAANGLLDNVDEQHGCLHSPEIQRQSDVYGFGVLLLELLSGNEPLKYNIVQTARLIFSCGEEEDEIDNKVRLWMDERLTKFFPLKIAKNVMRVALVCLSMDHSERPDMAFMEGFIFDCIRMSNNIKYYQIL
ncbi:Leucine-rich repeat receptor-like protein kinase PXC2 [Linum perenne]